MAQQATGGAGQRDDWRSAAGFLSGEDNYYKLLDVPMTANRREIARAYRMIMMKWHPDKVRPEQREHAFAAIRARFAASTSRRKIPRPSSGSGVRSGCH